MTIALACFSLALTSSLVILFKGSVRHAKRIALQKELSTGHRPKTLEKYFERPINVTHTRQYFYDASLIRIFFKTNFACSIFVILTFASYVFDLDVVKLSPNASLTEIELLCGLTLLSGLSALVCGFFAGKISPSDNTQS